TKRRKNATTIATRRTNWRNGSPRSGSWRITRGGSTSSLTIMSVVRRRRTPENSKPVSARPRVLSLMASLLTGRGWLFDLYPIRRGMQVWFLPEDGGPIALWERYAPSFYVRGRAATLSRGLSVLRRPATVTRKARVDVWTGRPVPVFEVRVEDALRYAGVVARPGRTDDAALGL